MSPLAKAHYRSDVDGLRAVAVATVVLFHLEVTGFSGGFVGVDVFFVISGYLITQKLLGMVEANGRVDFVAFYVGRVRRLFPALFVTVAVSLIGAMIWLSPDNLLRFAYSAITAVVSVSNVFFWSEAGYWDAAAYSKPLLHTWSLSVEEQFYLIWPSLIALVVGFARHRGFILTLIVLTLLSLLAAEWMVARDAETAFYLTPFRVCEFAIGGLCVYLDGPARRLPNSVRELLTLSGLAMILYSATQFDESTRFPGLSSMTPCLGTAAVILANQARFSGTLLANRPMVFTGLISYSLYLVHWPLVVFYRQANPGSYAAVDVIGLIVATFVLAWLLYTFVETPLRRPRLRPPKQGSAASVGLSAMTAAFVLTLGSVAIIGGSGLPQRFDDAFAGVVTLTKTDVNHARLATVREICPTGSRTPCGEIARGRSNVVILGDSHGPDALTFLSRAYPEVNFILYWTGGCPPVTQLGSIKVRNAGDCTAFNEARFGFVANHPEVDAVVLTMMRSGNRTAPLLRTVADLRDQDRQVVVVGPGPYFTEDLYEIALRHGQIEGLDAAAARYIQAKVTEDEHQIREDVTSLGADYIDVASFFCAADQCRTLTVDERTLVTFDVHHLTYEAAVEFGEHLRSQTPDLFAARVDLSAITRQQATHR